VPADDGAVVVTCADTTTVTLRPPFPWTPGPALLASKVDARLVQGRTAAGGWSQQRFARRRANQTDAVVAAAADTAARVLLPAAAEVAALVTGGDRGLVDEVLADQRLKPLVPLRRDALDVGEPTKAVLLTTPQQFRGVDVHIVEPGERPGNVRDDGGESA